MKSFAATLLMTTTMLSAGFIAAACSPPKTTDNPMATPSAAATLPGANADVGKYVADAAIGDMFEIESSKIALAKSQNAAIKSFAQEMIDAHMATSSELKPIAEGASITPPLQMDDAHNGKLKELTDASPADFDKKYLDMQTQAHEAALNLHRDFAEKTADGPFKAFAAKTWPAVQAHLDHVRGLDKSSADGTPK